jgi:glucokinase
MNQPNDKTYVGIDIGATHARLAIVDAKGRVLADRTADTPHTNGGADLVDWIEQAYHTCREETDSFPPPAAAGVGVPGMLDPGSNAVIRAANMPFIEGLPLRDAVVERTGLATFLDSDAVAAGWGEFCCREKASKRFACLQIGTGVGGAVILDGAILRHTRHTAGHLGHLICDTAPDAPTCRAGVRGSLESRVCGPALQRAATTAGFDKGLDDIELAYHEGDASAADFINDNARYLSITILNIAHIYAVDTLVIGGGIAIALPSLIRQAAIIAAQSESALIPPGMRVDLHGLGQYAGSVGAALLACEKFAQSAP